MFLGSLNRHLFKTRPYYPCLGSANVTVSNEEKKTGTYKKKTLFFTDQSCKNNRLTHTKVVHGRDPNLIFHLISLQSKTDELVVYAKRSEHAFHK